MPGSLEHCSKLTISSAFEILKKNGYFEKKDATIKSLAAQVGTELGSF